VNTFKVLFFLIINLIINPATASDDNTDYNFVLPGKVGEVRLDDYKGKVVYLDFWASWCGPCQQSFPWMSAMQEKYQSQGFDVIAINLDVNSDDAYKFLKGNAPKFTIAFDKKGLTPRVYGVKGMPSSYIFNREGKLVYKHIGFNESDKPKLEQKLLEILRSK
jgi:cytochrome c biogenesis protein CcmG/thiol:disulfide interchange protein DsbE